LNSIIRDHWENIMRHYESLDALVRARLKTWPQRPPGMEKVGGGADTWLRGRPADKYANNPYLKLPGSDRFRTLPDGLWLNFAGTPVEPFVDILAIEACGSLQNLLDKRSRFAPSTHSLLAVCPVVWLLAAVSESESTPRWEATGLLRQEPVTPFVLPVLDVKVLYGLKHRHYEGFTKNQIPHAHEYFVPMESLTAQEGDKDPALQALIGRAAVRGNFLSPR
jgi:hypothetical protein